MTFRTSVRTLQAMLWLLGTLLAAELQALPLLTQLPAATAVGIQSDSSTGSLIEPLGLGPATITSVSWWGYYGIGSPADDSFTLLLDGIVQAGALTTTQVGIVDGFDLYRYDLSLSAPLVFSGGPILLMDLINDSLSVEWYWQGTTDAFSPRAVLLEGTSGNPNGIPEPGSVLLMMIGAAALRRMRGF